MGDISNIHAQPDADAPDAKPQTATALEQALPLLGETALFQLMRVSAKAGDVALTEVCGATLIDTIKRESRKGNRK